jgi:FAD/FMN-containing dehydrogenase
VPTIRVQGACLGSASDTAALLTRFEAAVGAPPSNSAVSDPQPYLTAMVTEAGCATIGYQACHLPWYAPDGTLKRQAQFSKSDFFTAALSDSGIGALLAGVAALRTTAGAPGGIGGIQLDSFGGAINRVSPGATAFVHRNALFMAQYTTDWYAGATAAEINNQHAWIRSFWASMRPYASGEAYVNYIDPDLINWRQAYYGANYPRLAVIKREYDPTGLFTFPQAITHAGRM